ALKDLPSTVISSPEKLTSPSSRPRIESYFRRGARLLLSVRSLTPTHSLYAPAALAARKKLRPILPKPLMPTRTVTEVSSQRTGRTGAVGDCYKDAKQAYAVLYRSRCPDSLVRT